MTAPKTRKILRFPQNIRSFLLFMLHIVLHIVPLFPIMKV